MKRLAIFVFSFTVFVSTIQSVHAKARPVPTPQETAVPGNQGQPQPKQPDPIFQCQYCKRSFKGSEGKMIRFHVRETEDHWICVDCFYDALDYAQKYKSHVEAARAKRKAK